MFLLLLFSCSVMSDSFQPRGLQPLRRPPPWVCPPPSCTPSLLSLLGLPPPHLISSTVSVIQSSLTVCEPMDVARQAPLSMGFLRPRCWSGFPFPPPGDLPNPEIKPRSPTLQADSFINWATVEAQEDWSGQPVPSPEDLPDPGIKPGSPALQADSLPTELLGKNGS